MVECPETSKNKKKSGVSKYLPSFKQRRREAKKDGLTGSGHFTNPLEADGEELEEAPSLMSTVSVDDDASHKMGKLVRMDKYGFLLDDERDASQLAPSSSCPDVMDTAARVKKWESMLDKVPKKEGSSQSKVKYYTRRGLPDKMRSRAWTVLTGVDAIMSEKGGEYQQLVHRADPDKGPRHHRSDSMGERSAETSVLETIERDIHRTFPRHYLFHKNPDDDSDVDSVPDSDSDDDDDDHSAGNTSSCHDTEQDPADTEAKKKLFNDMIVRSTQLSGLDGLERDKCDKEPHADIHTVGSSTSSQNEAADGQGALRRVLSAYSIYDSEVGYCQGMNFIAAMFITFLSEEEAFWLLVVVMNEEPYKLRELFGEDMAGTHEVLYIAEKLMHQFLPKLSQHLENENIHISMFVTQWLLTIYTSTFPFELVARVWDCFLVEGWKVVYRVMLSLLEHASKDLMDFHFEQILHYFRDLPQKVDGSTIMTGSLKIALKRKHIQKHVNEWRRSNGTTESRNRQARRNSNGSSASSTLNSIGHGSLPSLSTAKGFLKRPPKEIIIDDISNHLIPIIGTSKFAVVLYNILSPEECSEIIDRMEEYGFEDASIYGPGKEVLRNCTRCVSDDPILAENWFERILHALKGTELEQKIEHAPWVGKGTEAAAAPLYAVSLNERFRVLKYEPGQFFTPHNDARFTRGLEHGDRAGEASCVTVQVYLNDKFKGGMTRFKGGRRFLDVVPKTGSILLFDHNILHEGCKVTSGKKYIVRTDIMYSRKPGGFTGLHDRAFQQRT